MSDDEDAMMNGVAITHNADDKDVKHSSTSDDDDDSSSSSSGSSSSSDSSDSESDNDGESREQQQQQRAVERKYSTESVASSNGRALSSNAAEPLTDVNSNRAAARFREQNSEVGLMALGTKKRDRRTIEEIQRDLQRKRSRAGSIGASNGASTKSAYGGAGGARASPPKGSPALSPEPPGDATQLGVGLPPIKMPKGKLNSARSRLTMKILGRGRPNPVPPPKPAVLKKSAAGAAMTGAGATAAGSSAGIVTNISAGAKTSKALGNDLDSYVAEQRIADSSRQQLEAKIEPKIIDWKPDGKVVRSILRAMLRFGDLTDVGICASQREAFADEHRLANFVVRSNLPATTKVPEDKLLKTANDIAERVQRAIDDKQDAMKYADVEVKPSQIIERLYENLKLRVAVQRALRDARYTKTDDKGAYVLVAKQADLPTLGISRDFPAWSWAEKEHDWNSRKDTALLLGIYVHGFGAWEDILNDDLLHFHQQRALKGERMKKRAENLLKRLPPPDADVAELRVVSLASALAAASQTTGQSIGTVLSAIIHNNNNNSGGASGSVVANSLNKGRLQRAADRLAARQGTSSSNIGVLGSSSQRSGVPEDSIRRAHTQSSNSNHMSSSSSSSSVADRHRKPSIASPAISLSAAVLVAAGSTHRSDDEPEDGEVDSTAPVPARSSNSNSRASSPAKRPAVSTTASLSSSKASSKRRSASVEREAKSSSESARKRSKSSAEQPARKSKSQHKKSKKSKKSKTTNAPPVVLSPEACLEKWKPSKKLKDIRTVLKKMKIMASWSKNQKDEVVVEKVYKYVTTIGDAIDSVVRQAAESTDAHEWDELCSSLWRYAAGYTPFSSVTFERLYDDICADGEALRRTADGAAATDSTTANTSRRPSAAST